MFEIVTERIDTDAVIGAVADPRTGATVSFLGTTRDHNEGRRVTRLEYEAYPAMARAEMGKIADTVRERHRGIGLIFQPHHAPPLVVVACRADEGDGSARARVGHRGNHRVRVDALGDDIKHRSPR